MIGWIDIEGNRPMARVITHAALRIAQRNEAYPLEQTCSMYLRHSEMINTGEAEKLYSRQEADGKVSTTFKVVNDNGTAMFPVVKHIGGAGYMICTYLTEVMVSFNLSGVDENVSLPGD